MVTFGQAVFSSPSFPLGPFFTVPQGPKPLIKRWLSTVALLSLEVSSQGTQDGVLDSSLSVMAMHCSMAVSALSSTLESVIINIIFVCHQFLFPGWTICTIRTARKKKFESISINLLCVTTSVVQTGSFRL